MPDWVLGELHGRIIEKHQRANDTALFYFADRLATTPVGITAWWKNGPTPCTIPLTHADPADRPNAGRPAMGT